MNNSKEVISDAIKVTAELIKENKELKKENYELKKVIRWCWRHAGTVAVMKAVDWCTRKKTKSLLHSPTTRYENFDALKSYYTETEK